MKHYIAVLFYLIAIHSSTSYARLLRSNQDITEEQERSLSSWAKQLQNEKANSTSAPQTRVVGGTIASQGDFPWFVAPKSHLFLCGASLIHNDIVLSAAHCPFEKGMEVIVGALFRNSEKGGAQKRTIVETLRHPEYDDVQAHNDIMVFKLDSPVTNVETVVYNTDDSTPEPGDTLTSMGFGSLDSLGTGNAAYFLRKVDITSFTFTTCERQYVDVLATNLGERLVLDEEIQLCAGYSRGGRGSCDGDSGGPLINSQGVQVGVVSIGVECASADFAVVYARVSAATDFIEQGICNLSSNPPRSC